MNDSTRTEEVKVCIICGNHGQHPFYKASDLNQKTPGEHTIVKCNTCGLAFISPRPKKQYIGDYYPSDYWRGAPSRDEILEGYKEIYDQVEKLPAGSMLDVGAGGGYFLSLFDKWRREGTELSKETAAHASKSYDFKIHPGELEDNISGQTLQNGPYDVITLNSVLEHVYHPRETIRSAHTLLKSQGLIIITVPNFGSFSRRLAGAKWYHLDPPRHLFHFDTHLLKRLLESEGFKVTNASHFNHAHNTAGYRVSIERLVEPRNRVIRKATRVFTRLTYRFMPWLLSSFKLGDVITLYAKKTN